MVEDPLDQSSAQVLLHTVNLDDLLEAHYPAGSPCLPPQFDMNISSIIKRRNYDTHVTLPTS